MIFKLWGACGARGRRRCGAGARETRLLLAGHRRTGASPRATVSPAYLGCLPRAAGCVHLPPADNGWGRAGQGGAGLCRLLRCAALHMSVLPARGCPVHFCAATPCCARTPSTTSARQHRGEDLAAPAGQGGAVARSGGRQRRRAAHLLAVGRGWRRDCVCRGKSGGRGSSRPREEENAASDSRAHWAAAGAVAPSAAAHQLALLDPSALHSATPAAATSSRRCLRWTRRCSATRTLPSSAREGCGGQGGVGWGGSGQGRRMPQPNRRQRRGSPHRPLLMPLACRCGGRWPRPVGTSPAGGAAAAGSSGSEDGWDDAGGLDEAAGKEVRWLANWDSCRPSLSARALLPPTCRSTLGSAGRPCLQHGQRAELGAREGCAADPRQGAVQLQLQGCDGC